MKKTISIVVPTYNEEQNIANVYSKVTELFQNELSGYEMELLFIDNASTDKSQDMIQQLTKKDSRVQAIFNATNFGFSRSSFYGLSQAEGDCAVMMYADLQDPPEVIPEFVKKWEEGYQIAVGIKSKSKENRFMYAVRGIYYHILDKISEVDHIKQFDGFGLYDRTFVEELRRLEDPLPYLRGLVAELGAKRAEVEYEQQLRKKGKTSFNFLRYYDVAMLGITSSSKAIMRMATFLGMGLSVICIFIALITLILKLINWNYYDIGTAAIIIGIFFVGGIQTFFLGFLGEYIVNINIRTMKHPVVVEAKRINMRRTCRENLKTGQSDADVEEK